MLLTFPTVALSHCYVLKVFLKIHVLEAIPKYHSTRCLDEVDLTLVNGLTLSKRQKWAYFLLPFHLIGMQQEGLCQVPVP